MGINKALVVDDSRLARVALSKLLMRRGMDVDTAECGNDALRYLSEASPDVVFLDYMMPDMDGFQAAEAINRLRGDRAVPLVMYTSQDTAEDRQRASTLGICGFLSKPTSDDRLDAVLDQVMAWQLSRNPLGEPATSSPTPAAEPRPAQPSPPAPAGGREPYRSPAPEYVASEPVPEFGEPARVSTADMFSRQPEQETLLPPHSAYVVEPEPVQESPRATPPVPTTPPVHQPPAEPSISAEQVRGIAEQVSRQLQQESDQRWLQQLEQEDRRWEQRLRAFGDELQEAATEAATLAGQQAAQYAGREAMELVREEMHRAGRDVHEAAQGVAERAARGAAEDAARRLMQEQVERTEQVARQVAEELAEQAAGRAAAQVAQQAAQQVSQQVARQVAQQVAEDLLSQARERDQDGGESTEEEVRKVLDAAIGDLARQPAFRDQVTAAISEHAVPLLKNRLENWVLEQARESAMEAVDQAVDKRLQMLVQKAVVASAEAAAREADALHRRWRLLTVAGAAVLGLGVMLALAIAV